MMTWSYQCDIINKVCLAVSDWDKNLFIVQCLVVLDFIVQCSVVRIVSVGWIAEAFCTLIIPFICN